MDDAQQDHQRIVAGLRERCGGNWPLLAQDDDARQHLAGHLDGAGLWDELLALTTASDAWAKARSAAEGNYDGYLSDLELVRQRAASLTGGGWGIRVRCALLESSVRSLERGQVGDQHGRAMALWKLTMFLPDALKAEARAAVLAALRRMQGEDYLAEYLSWLAEAEHLPGELMDEALAVARGFRHGAYRAEALAALSVHLPNEWRSQVAQEALVTALKLDEQDRSWVLLELAEHLPDESQDQVLAAAGAISDQGARARVLAYLVSYLPDRLKEGAARQALAAVRGLREQDQRSSTLSALAQYLPDELKGEALAVARELDETCRAETLGSLAEYLPDRWKAEVRREALAVARGIRDEAERARALRVLMEYSPDELQGEALVAARGLRDRYQRAQALVGLTEDLDGAPQAELAAEALAAVTRLENEGAQEWLLRRLASYLPDDRKDPALALACGLEHEKWRAQALRALVRYLPNSLRMEALAAARGIADGRYRWLALIQLAHYLPELQAEAFSALLVAGRYDQRSHLVDALTWEVPLLESLGGVPAVAALLHGIVDTAVWWP